MMMIAALSLANALVSDSRIEKSLSYAMMMYHNIAFATPLFFG
jgi:hypothetical protein